MSVFIAIDDMLQPYTSQISNLSDAEVEHAFNTLSTINQQSISGRNKRQALAFWLRDASLNKTKKLEIDPVFEKLKEGYGIKRDLKVPFTVSPKNET